LLHWPAVLIYRLIALDTLNYDNIRFM
jgi:hypothetical protein